MSCSRKQLPSLHPVYMTLAFLSLIALLHLIVFADAAAFISGTTIKCYNEGEDVHLPLLYDEPCMTCKCLNQEIVCNRDQCNRNRKCNHNGREIKSGETWKNGTCNRCSCNSGSISCQAEVCDDNLKCPENERLIQHPGECCKSCAENDGECSLIGSRDDASETIVSFDRRSTPFEGKCNYRLAHDCLDKSFWIHLRHESLNETTSDKDPLQEEPSRSLVVRIQETRIQVTRLNSPDSETSEWKLRVGRRESSFPFIKLGVLTAHRNQRGVSIRTNIGVKVSWNGLNDLRITLPSKFKSRMCGLCGNFNGKPEDDRLTRKGRYVKTFDKFVNSWKVGKTGYCAAVRSFKEEKNQDLGLTRSFNQLDACSTNWEKKMKAMSTCNVLKDMSTFGLCHRHISIIPFYKECVSKMCDCPQNNCYCSSVVSYIHQCAQIGIKVNDDKTRGVCGSFTIPPSLDSRNTTSRPLRHFNQKPKDKNARQVCPFGSTFNTCVNSCRKTCKNPEGLPKEECPRPCRPGCECSGSLVWHESRCVSTTECPEMS